MSFVNVMPSRDVCINIHVIFGSSPGNDKNNKTLCTDVDLDVIIEFLFFAKMSLNLFKLNIGNIEEYFELLNYFTVSAPGNF